MGTILDIHCHTQRYSGCSRIDENDLIPRALAAGLDGLVITEHHYQWRPSEIAALRMESGAPEDFVLLAAFEYCSEAGDILIYGLDPEEADRYDPYDDPVAVVQRAQASGAACVAAHPTRACLGFDRRLADIPFDGIEVRSVNLTRHEQNRAAVLAETLQRPGVAASDAHASEDIGAHATEFDGPVGCLSDLRDCLRHGRFRVAW